LLTAFSVLKKPKVSLKNSLNPSEEDKRLVYPRNDVRIGIYAIPVSLSVTPSARHLSQRARLAHDSNFLAKTKKHKINQQFQSSNKTTKSSQPQKVPSKSNTSIKQQKPQIITNQKVRQRNLGV